LMFAGFLARNAAATTSLLASSLNRLHIASA
jgi:hypothetical protein